MKDILVRVSDPSAWDRDAQAAARIAAALGGNLTGVYTTMPGVAPPAFYDPGVVAAE